MKETMEKVQKEQEAKDLEYKTAQCRSELLYTHNKNLTKKLEREKADLIAANEKLEAEKVRNCKK